MKVFYKFFLSMILAMYPLFSTADQVPIQPLSPALPAKSGNRILTDDVLLSIPSSMDILFPKVKWLDHTNLILSLQSTNRTWMIEKLDLRTQKLQSLGEGYAPRISPDGKWIAYIHNIDNSPELWIMRSNGSKAKKLSLIEEGKAFYGYTYDFSWSPDSKQIALVHQKYNPRWEKQKPSESYLEIINILNNQSKRVAAFDASIREISWFPNSGKILFMKERIGSAYNENEDKTWVQTIDVNNGQLQTLAKFDGLQQSLSPTVSPDGQTVAVTYDAEHPQFNAMLSIGLISMDTVTDNTVPPIRQLTKEMQLAWPMWEHNNRNIMAVRIYGAYRQIYSIDKESGSATQITKAPASCISYSLSPSDSRLAWVTVDAHSNYAVNVAENDGSNTRRVLTIPGVAKDFALSEVREISWSTKNYPAQMAGLLVLPLHYQNGQRYPLIVDIHGGGVGASIFMMGGILMNSPLEWQMWAAKGYAVFIPEMRSSGSFGSLGFDRILKNRNEELHGDLQDIETGIDELIDLGIADSERIAVIGHSAGGHRANKLTVSTHRFKAIVSKEGWADDVVAEDASTPTLFLMGNPKLGGVDPNNTVKQLHSALKARGITTEYIQYEDEGHLLIKPANRRDALSRVVKWISDLTLHN